jgi:hypothetical protein
MMAYFLVRELYILSENYMLDSVIGGKKSGTILSELQAKETKIRYGLTSARCIYSFYINKVRPRRSKQPRGDSTEEKSLDSSPAPKRSRS